LTDLGGEWEQKKDARKERGTTGIHRDSNNKPKKVVGKREESRNEITRDRKEEVHYPKKDEITQGGEAFVR